jgi:histidinol-phosphatase (PHP family)
MPFSHHSHSGQFCGHAVNTLEEVLQAAIEKELKVYAFTEHIPRDDADLYPEEVRDRRDSSSACANTVSGENRSLP